jgi:hypothetical protein
MITTLFVPSCEIEMFSVIAPVVALFVTSLNPFSERTGPLKVVLAMSFSCLGKCQPHCGCQGYTNHTEVSGKKKGATEAAPVQQGGVQNEKDNLIVA